MRIASTHIIKRAGVDQEGVTGATSAIETDTVSELGHDTLRTGLGAARDTGLFMFSEQI
jgi:hypothetical protein